MHGSEIQLVLGGFNFQPVPKVAWVHSSSFRMAFHSHHDEDVKLEL